MQIVLRLSASEGRSNWLSRSRVLGTAIKAILDTQVRLNRLYLARHRGVPPLYASGVRYRNEPKHFKFLGETAEEFALIPIVLARGWGDCDDLSPYRCAELQHHGEPAKMRVQWKRRVYPNGRKGRKYYHIVVRRGDGSIEDPSARLGMHDRSAAAV